MSKLQRRRLVVLGTVSLIAISMAIFTTVSSYIRITKLDRHYKELSMILEKLKDDEVAMSSDIKKLNDPEYIAMYARENYLYSKTGEYVIKLDNEDNLIIEETSSSKKDTFNQSLIITIAIVLTFLILFRLFKRKKKDD